MKKIFKRDSLIDDESLYLIATEEFDSDAINDALWAKSMALSKGDIEQARYKYIELRVEQLKKNDSKEADQENKPSINSSHWTFKGVGKAIIFTYPTMFLLQWFVAVSGDYAPKDALFFTIETSLSGGFSSLLLAGFLISLVGLSISRINKRTKTRTAKEVSTLNIGEKIENEITGTLEEESKGETGEAENWKEKTNHRKN